MFGMIEINKIKKIVVKVGSSLIANYKTSSIKQSWVDSLVEDLNILFKNNIKILIVSSGAIAIGRKKIKNDGKKICGYAATAKSTTILNYCNLNTDTIDFICDSTKEKIGKFSPGAHIPIVPVSHFHKNLPDVAYLFAWNHKDEIFSKEKEFLKKGGSWFSHVSL